MADSRRRNCAMKLNIYYLFLFAGVLAASFSQVLLKKAACRQYGSFIREYLNPLSLIHISEPTRLGMISYAVFCLKKKKK